MTPIPTAILSVLVQARGVKATNAQLMGTHTALLRTAKAAQGAAASTAALGKTSSTAAVGVGKNADAARANATATGRMATAARTASAASASQSKAAVSAAQAVSGQAAATNAATGATTRSTAAMRAMSAAQTAVATTSGRASKMVGTLGKGAAAGLAFGLYSAAKAGADFEQQMSSLGAVTEASRKQMRKLDQQAIRLGASTVFSASETAQAQIELAKGGLEVSQILGGSMEAALDLAAAGELGLAEAAETTVNAMKLFGIEGKATRQVADMLATAANKTTADVSDFAMSLKMGGSAAKQAGYDLNQTVVVLEALADIGIRNSDAGTSMKTAMIQLLKPTDKQAKLAKKLGIEWTTQNGTLKDAAGLSNELREAMDGMTKAERVKTLAVLAGTDGFRTLAALYDTGAEKLDEYSRANLRHGTAAEVAARKLDNWRGDVEELQGAYETLQIKVFKQMRPAMRDVTQLLTGAVSDATPAVTREMNEIVRLITDPDLSGAERTEEITRYVTDAVETGAEAAARAAGAHGPQIALALGEGFTDAWTDMNPIGKLFATAAIIRMVGGKGAVLGTGKLLGRYLGAGVSTGAATTIASGTGASKGGIFATGKMAKVGRAAGVIGGVALVNGVIEGIASEEPNAVRKFGDFADGLTFGLLPGGGRKLDERLAEITKGIKDWKPPRIDMGDIFSGDDGGLFGILGSRQLKDFEENEQQLIKGMVRLRNKANELLGPGAKLSDEAWVNPEGTVRSFRRVEASLSNLRSGFLTTHKDISKVSKRNMDFVAKTWGEGTATGRKLAAQNLRATADAMVQTGNITDQGMKRIMAMYRRADLLTATRRSAQGIAREWTKGMFDSEKATRKSMRVMLREMQEMPAPARQAAFDVWNRRLAVAVKNGKLEADEARKLRSQVLTQFDALKVRGITKSGELASGVAGNFQGMTVQALAALDSLNTQANSLYSKYGLQPINWKAVPPRTKGLKGIAADIGAGMPTSPLGRQRGGPINVGKPHGDSVPAMLEKGEYVLNRNAVKAVGKQQLDAINFGLAKRFQKGGVAGGLSFALGPYSIPPIQYAADHAGGNSHVHITGTTPQWVVAIGKKLQQMGFHVGEHPAFGGVAPVHSATGGHYDARAIDVNSANDETRAEVAAIARLLGGAGVGMGVPKLGMPTLSGPDGALKDLGNAVIKKAFKAAERYLERQTAGMMSGVAPLGGPSGSGSWQDALHQIAGSRGWDAAAWMELVMRESSGNPQAVNPSSGAFGLGQFLGTTADAYAPFGAKSSDPVKQIQAMAKYIADRYGNPTSALSFHDSHNWYAAGGAVGIGRAEVAKSRAKKRGDGPFMGGSHFPSLRAFRVGASKQGHRQLKKLYKQIKGFGLSGEMISRLTGLSADADKFNEYATNAGGLTTHDSEGNPIPGVFAGQPETAWLTNEIESLFSLRNQVLHAKEMAERRRKQVAKQVAAVKKQIAKVRAALGAEQRRQRNLQLQIRTTKKTLEKQIDEMQDAKSEAEKISKIKDKSLPVTKDARRRALRDRAKELAKLPAAQRKFEVARARVQETRGRIAGLTGQARISADWVKTHQGNLQGLQGGRKAYEGSFQGLGTTISELLGDGGQLRGRSFHGLKSVQGSGGPQTILAFSKPLDHFGTLGGSILAAQGRLKQIDDEAKQRISDRSQAAAEEQLRLTQELLRQANQRTAVSERQFQVFAQLPPNFAGIFHQGGIVPGTGESTAIVKGREGIFTPEQMRALAPAGGDGTPNINLRVVVYEGEKVEVYADDRKIEAQIERHSRRAGRRVGSVPGRGGVFAR